MNDRNPKITKELIAEHGLSGDEYEHVLKVLGREPNLTELGIFSVMWSEHCSYKSSRIYFKMFPTDGPYVLQGPGENAGVIDIGDGIACSFKMESHNHPSFIEPYQGAATGVGGILRDIFTMGARPIANLNSIRFGSTSNKRTPYLLKGVVAGIAGYGNTMGIPTVGGEVVFDENYEGNILVNAFTLGLMDSNKIFLGKAEGIGNPVIYVGNKTGRDGIHGATMASDVFGEGGEERRPTVQVGDPFIEKLLLEACQELMATDAIVGIQDMGAAGLTCSTFEMADRAGSGIDVDLDRVPKREDGMTPYEIMLSESQERMLLVAKQGREGEVRKIFEKWGLDVAVVGKVTDTGRVRVYQGGAVVAEIPVAPIVHESPLYERPTREPSWQREVQKLDLSKITTPKDLNETLLKMMSSPNLADKSWVYEQYDHMVMTNTVVRPGSDAAVVRVKGTKKGVAMTVDCNARACYLDPYAGAVLSVAEAARNLSCAGAVPMAITDCLNFGNPERPEIMWQFKQSVAGIADACRKFETPVTGGNVSFYNETKGVSIYPTPAIGMVGLIEDIGDVATAFWKREGDMIILLGSAAGDISASEYLKYIHGEVRGRPANVDYKIELAVQRAVRTGIKRGIVKSAHDISDGGLAVTLAESSIARPEGMLGVRVRLESSARPDALLFGEAPSRIVLSVARENVDMMLHIAKEFDAKAQVIGEVGGARLVINDLISIDLSKLYEGWKGTIPMIAGK